MAVRPRLLLACGVSLGDFQHFENFAGYSRGEGFGGKVPAAGRPVRRGSFRFRFEREVAPAQKFRRRLFGNPERSCGRLGAWELVMDEINFCALLTSSLNAAVVVETRNEQASNADLVLGQSSKKLYRRFLGKNVTVHQYTQVYCIPFAPEMNTAIARRK